MLAAETYALEGDAQEALALCERALDIAEEDVGAYPADAERVLLGALTAIATGLRERAVVLLKRYGKRYGSSKAAILLTCLALAQQGMVTLESDKKNLQAQAPRIRNDGGYNVAAELLGAENGCKTIAVSFHQPSESAHPQIARAIFVNGLDRFHRRQRRFWISGKLAILEPAEKAACGNPNHSLMVFQNAANVIHRQAIFLAEGTEMAARIMRQPGRRSDPGSDGELFRQDPR